jgi:hypothetical protein
VAEKERSRGKDAVISSAFTVDVWDGCGDTVVNMLTKIAQVLPSLNSHSRQPRVARDGKGKTQSKKKKKGCDAKCGSVYL